MARQSVFTTPPRIETDRLVLRAHRPEDFAACIAMWSDPLVLRFIRTTPYPSEEIWTRMLRFGGHWQWFGYGFWVIQDKLNGQFIGEAGVQNFERNIDVEFSGKPELGYSLISTVHGKGYATEAALAAVTWFELHTDLPYSNCTISPKNLGSQNVALKCGYRYVGEARHRGDPVSIYRRERQVS